MLARVALDCKLALAVTQAADFLCDISCHVPTSPMQVFCRPSLRGTLWGLLTDVSTVCLNCGAVVDSRFALRRCMSCLPHPSLERALQRKTLVEGHAAPRAAYRLIVRTTAGRPHGLYIATDNKKRSVPKWCCRGG